MAAGLLTRVLMRLIRSLMIFSAALLLATLPVPPARAAAEPAAPASPAPTKSLEYRFGDGVTIRVHYSDETLHRYGEDASMARRVLDAAVQAYQTITEFSGFSTPGYTFAAADESYAYDPDRTIDVYLGDPADDEPFKGSAYAGLTFRDAPCFDTRQRSPTAFDAVILLPANYKNFINNWEKLNPSSLGPRNVEVDLRGTLMHEMLHAVLFYYNKNLDKEGRDGPAGDDGARRIDWYIEGLARYFETFAGARHDFFSQGFKQTLPDKVRFSRGGSNYFMRYPDQAFTELRYENALFWRFVHDRFGMERIEDLSRRLRKSSREPTRFRVLLEEVTGVPFEELLQRFALAILLKDFGLKTDAAFLLEVARTRLAFAPDGGLELVDGREGRRELGRACRTDWIGRWEGFRAVLDGPPAAGDGTPRSDVSGWATDFYEIAFEGGALPAGLNVRHEGAAGEGLSVQFVVVSKGDSRIVKSLPRIRPGQERSLDLARTLRENGLREADLEKIWVLVTNADPSRNADYALLAPEV